MRAARPGCRLRSHGPLAARRAQRPVRIEHCVAAPDLHARLLLPRLDILERRSLAPRSIIRNRALKLVAPDVEPGFARGPPRCLVLRKGSSGLTVVLPGRLLTAGVSRRLRSSPVVHLAPPEYRVPMRVRTLSVSASPCHADRLASALRHRTTLSRVERVSKVIVGQRMMTSGSSAVGEPSKSMFPCPKNT